MESASLPPQLLLHALDGQRAEVPLELVEHFDLALEVAVPSYSPEESPALQKGGIWFEKM